MKECSICNNVIMQNEKDYLVSGLMLCEDCYKELDRCDICRKKLLCWEGVIAEKNNKRVMICNSCYEGVVEDD